MDIKRKRQEVVDLIDNLKEHSDRLAEQQIIPSLELNVILSKISKLYEKTAVLKYLSANEKHYSGNADDIHTNRTVDTQKTQKIENEENEHKIEKGIPNSEIEQNVNPSVQGNQINEPTGNQNIDIERNEPIQQHTVPNQSTDNTNVDQKIIGKVEDYLDVNSRFSQHEDPSLSHQLKKQPIANLMTAIGLNERYLFANQLFDGNMENFIDEVKKLNTFESEKEAMSYFDNELIKKNNWDSKNELVAGFRLLVERRFNQ